MEQNHFQSLLGYLKDIHTLNTIRGVTIFIELSPYNFSNFHKHRSVAAMEIFNLHVLKESLGFRYLQRTVLRLGNALYLSLLLSVDQPLPI
jgi:hypothetical protein